MKRRAAGEPLNGMGRLDSARPRPHRQHPTPNTQHPTPARRAFTLLEVLLALLLVGVLAAGVGLALRTGLDASDRIRERTEIHAEGRAAIDLMAADLGAAFLSGANTEETRFSAEPPQASEGWEPFLQFTTLSFRHSAGAAAAEGESRSDAVHVEYALQPNGPGGLPVLMRRERWLTEPGEGETTVSCERVSGLQLRYLGDDFQEGWTADPESDLPVKAEEGTDLPSPVDRSLPKAVEIVLMLAPREDRENDKPRAYKTLVQVGTSGVAPFEVEITPTESTLGGGNPGGNPGGGPGG